MNATPLRQDLADSLKKSGFTDVKVVPDSFFVQAKDKSGNPISMLISPNSVTEMTNVPIGVAGGASANGQTGSTFVASAAGDTLSSKLVGTDVHNSANQDIGTIKDVAMPQRPGAGLRVERWRVPGYGRPLCRRRAPGLEYQL